LYQIWISTSVLLLLMHCVTVPLLYGIVGRLYPLPMLGAIILGEVAIVAIEATIIYVACLVSAGFRRSFLRCLSASAVGNSVSCFIPFAAHSLAQSLA